MKTTPPWVDNAARKTGNILVRFGRFLRQKWEAFRKGRFLRWAFGIDYPGGFHGLWGSRWVTFWRGTVPKWRAAFVRRVRWVNSLLIRYKPTFLALAFLVLVVSIWLLIALCIQSFGNQVIGGGAQGLVPGTSPVTQQDIDGVGAAVGRGPAQEFFVSLTGNDANDCTTWGKACATPSRAHQLCVSGRGDTVWLAPGDGVYTENSSADGLVLDKENVSVRCANYHNLGCQIENDTNTAGSTVVNVQADFVTLENLTIFNIAPTAANASGIYVTEEGDNLQIIDLVVPSIPTATRSAIFVDGAVGVVVRETTPGRMSIFGAVPGFNVGTGLVLSGTQFSGMASGSIVGFEIGVQAIYTTTFGAIAEGVRIQDVVTGTYLGPGVSDMNINALINADVRIQDESGNDTNRSDGSPTQRFEAILHAAEPPFPGVYYFVDGESGRDTNTCRSEGTPCATIQAAIDLCEAGCGIVVRADGTYTESLAFDVNALQFFPAQGVRIVGDVTISGDGTWWRRPVSVSGCVQVTGSDVRLEETSVISAVVAFDIDGESAVLRNVTARGYTADGYNISAQTIDIDNALAVGGGNLVRGFVFSNTTQSRVRNADSVGNALRGFLAHETTSDNTFAGCSSGGNDGGKLDEGLFNFWADFQYQMAIEHHEAIYPPLGGVGVASNPVTINNTTTDDAGGTREDQDYFGDVRVVIPRDTITITWQSIGIYIFATTAADIQPGEIFFTNDNYYSTQNGGNDWDQNETSLTVADGSAFQAGDVVWVTGNDRTDGEIQLVQSVVGNVVTILREATASGGLGLRYDYDGDPSDNRMYVVYRFGYPDLHKIEVDHTASGARDFTSYRWHEPKENLPNAAMLMRTYNGTDGSASAFDVRAIYED